MNKGKSERYVVIINREKVSELPLAEFLESEYETLGVKYSQTIKKALNLYRRVKNNEVTIIEAGNDSKVAEVKNKPTDHNPIQQEHPSTVTSGHSAKKEKPMLKGFNAPSNKDLL
ncbi:TPA: hypothetical protein IWM33_002370 [Enterococcus faecium]|nr:hypothetical protein [Enterococcus faecium]HAP6956888.1 hypothetical protein [Enterococcus faecium]HAP7045511.1 hypothetical protein [Enterococcus faecium]HAP7329277.1 hypothetical protein [Enterococcus faecium]HAP7395550.1 hypothetical protein [Enterococcus faecium]